MASITSLSGGSSSTNSIYGNANILSGLASGMDTEAMIENAVSGIQNKITSLQQDRTMIEWEQEAYRSIIDKMVNFANKYTSYSSSTNLLSEAFFRNALSVSTNGVNADKITASGRPTSTVQLLGVKQLATAASYRTTLAGSDAGKIVGDKDFSLDKKKQLGTLDGSMTLKFGSTTATIRFGKDDVYTDEDGNTDVGALVKGINEKLKGTDLEGKVSAQEDGNGGFKFVIDSKQLGYGNNVITITSVSGNLEKKLGVSADREANVHDTVHTITGPLSEKKMYSDLLADAKVTFVLDGVSKQLTFTADEVIDSTVTDPDEIAAKLEKINNKLKDAFGDGVVAERNANGALTFKVKDDSASTLRIEGGEVIGLKSNSETSYTNLSTKLGDLNFINFNALADDKVTDAEDPNNGKYKFSVNGEVIGYFDENSTLQDVMNAINQNSESDVTVSFSKLSNKFVFTAKDTGEASKVDFGTKGLAQQIFGTVEIDNKDKYTGGQDAIFSMSVDGEKFDGVSRSTNSFEVDGMTVNLNGTFGTYAENSNKIGDAGWDAALTDAVSFTAKTDSDKIIEVIKGMVDDYNEMANEIKDAYSTLPLYNSKGKRYEPLTEDDEKDMSDSAVERYNEKAKTGILFGDNVLSGLYEEIRSAINELGMSNIGITTAFTDGKTTLVVDETKLKDTLNNDPEKVTEVFTKSRENGASADGFMTKLKNTMDTYTKTTGKKGILIDLVGSTKSPLSLLTNTYKSKLDKLDETISRWQGKLSDKIDYYNRQFTRLEQMISQMNSQSSSLMGLMGY